MTRQPDFSSTPRTSPLRTAWRAAVAASVLLVGFVALAGWRARQEANEAQARLAEARRETERQAVRLRPLEAGRRARSGADGLSAPARVVAGIAAVLPPGARLERLAIDYTTGASASLELQVRARDAASWDRLLDALERSPDFREVEPGPESRQAEVDSVVRARWVGVAR